MAEASTFAASTSSGGDVEATLNNGVTGDGSHAPDSHESSLFATYEADQKKPFTAKYFDVSEVWNKEPTLERDLKEIEGYVREQVSNNKVENSTKAAEQFLKEMERKAGLTRYESHNQRITKLLAYIDFKRVVDS